MRKLIALVILLFSGLLAAQPLLAANPACGGCCEDMTGKSMVQCLSAGCQACANAPCLQHAEPCMPLPRATQALPATRDLLAPSPAPDIWTPPD